MVIDYNDVRTALGVAVQQYQPGLNVYYYVPKSLVPPAAIIKPQSQNVRTIDYIQGGGGSLLAKWFFNVLIVIGQPYEEASQEQAGALISPGSSLIASLKAVQLGRGYAEVTQGGISEMAFDQGSFTYAQLTVTVTA